MLFTPGHIQKIKNSQKTQTRRRISRFKKGKKKGKVVPPKRVGSIQPCKIWMFGKTLCHVKILKRWCERLGDISREDAFAEGQYTPEEYISGLIEMYDNTIDKNEVLWCYELEYVPQYLSGDIIYDTRLKRAFYVEDKNQQEKLEV